MDKSYPWICGNCAQIKVMPVIEDFKIQVSRGNKLYDVLVKNMPVPTCSNCGTQWLSIEHDDLIEQELKKLISNKEELNATPSRDNPDNQGST